MLHAMRDVRQIDCIYRWGWFSRSTAVCVCVCVLSTVHLKSRTFFEHVFLFERDFGIRVADFSPSSFFFFLPARLVFFSLSLSIVLLCSITAVFQTLAHSYRWYKKIFQFFFFSLHFFFFFSSIIISFFFM